MSVLILNIIILHMMLLIQSVINIVTLMCLPKELHVTVTQIISLLICALNML